MVRADGLISRGSNLTSSFRSSTGNSTVVTDRDVSDCATVGTRGSEDTAVPFNPATVEVYPVRRTTPWVSRSVKLLFFGGDFTDEAFHTAIAC